MEANVATYGPLNQIEVNGKSYWIDDADSFIGFLGDLGISKGDAATYLYADIEDKKTRGDGIFGDDYYEVIEAIHSECEDLKAEIDNLRSNSRKNNTKLDIARRLEAIYANLWDIL